MRRVASMLLAVSLLAACTPTYDWRDVRGTEASYTVLLPSKPSTHAREVNLGGIRTTMTMRAAAVENVTFAVGTAELADAAQAQAALQVMKNTMVGNINGVVRQEKSHREGALSTIDLIAGPAAGADGNAKALHARFVARERWVYQAVVVGREKSMRIEAVDTFLGSFKTP
ncbi:MAG: hypothetical protein V4695_08525 [Pseudomonadota bacterium]